MLLQKITVSDTLESLPPKVWWHYSNGQAFNGIYRATLHAIIQRGYYTYPTDPIDCAFIESI